MTMPSFFSFGALAALATCAGSACAQAAAPTVAFSGLVDIGVYRDSDSQWNVGPIQRSNLAAAVSQALSDDLTAAARLSLRFDTGTGAQESSAKPLFHDEATLGIQSKQFGSLKLGRRLDALYNNDWQFDPWYYFDRVASPAWDLWHYNYPSDPTANSGSPDYGRLNNGIFYDSPTVGGVTVNLSWSPQTASTARNKPFTTTLQYKNEVFQAMVSRGKNSAAATDTFVGLKTAIAGVSLMGARDVSKSGSSSATATTLGASYSLQKLTLRSGWGQVQVDGVRAEKVLGVGAVYAITPQFSTYADLAHKTYTSRSANTVGVGVAYSF